MGLKSQLLIRVTKHSIGPTDESLGDVTSCGELSLVRTKFGPHPGPSKIIIFDEVQIYTVLTRVRMNSSRYSEPNVLVR